MTMINGIDNIILWKSSNLKSTNTCFFIILGSFFIHLFKLISITNNHCSLKFHSFFINFKCSLILLRYTNLWNLSDFHHSAFTFVNMGQGLAFGFYLQHSLFQTIRACSFAVLTVVQHSIRRAMSNQQVDIFGDVFPTSLSLEGLYRKSTTGGFFRNTQEWKAKRIFWLLQFRFFNVTSKCTFQLRKNLLSWHLSCENTFVIVLSLNFESTFSWFPVMTILCVNFSLSRKIEELFRNLSLFLGKWSLLWIKTQKYLHGWKYRLSVPK